MRQKPAVNIAHSAPEVKSSFFYRTLLKRLFLVTFKKVRPHSLMVNPPAGGLLNSMFYVYAIRNTSDKIYIGHTENLEERLKRHNGILKNKTKSYTSKNRGPWKLIYKENCPTRQVAIRREKELKSFRGREFIRNLIKHNEL